MIFNQENKTIQLCTKGMEMEGQGELITASKLFYEAWEVAANDSEKFIAAHYVARHQQSISDKLRWDETALQFALRINDDSIKVFFPSLYLNIAKCHEDLNDLEKAGKNYHTALSFSNLLPDDGYGNMIKEGIMNGMKRVKDLKISLI